MAHGAPQRPQALARVMSYEYLWHNIREVGGAYGTGMLSSDGVEYLYTYRDPHVKESYDAFAKGPAELAAREYTEKDLNDLLWVLWPSWTPPASRVLRPARRTAGISAASRMK